LQTKPSERSVYNDEKHIDLQVEVESQLNYSLHVVNRSRGGRDNVAFGMRKLEPHLGT